MSSMSLALLSWFSGKHKSFNDQTFISVPAVFRACCADRTERRTEVWTPAGDSVFTRSKQRTVSKSVVGRGIAIQREVRPVVGEETIVRPFEVESPWKGFQAQR